MPKSSQTAENSRKRMEKGDTKDEEMLDQGLVETFPASDPVTVGNETGTEEQPAGNKDRKPPQLDHELIEELAKSIRKSTSS